MVIKDLLLRRRMIRPLEYQALESYTLKSNEAIQLGQLMQSQPSSGSSYSVSVIVDFAPNTDIVGISRIISLGSAYRFGTYSGNGLVAVNGKRSPDTTSTNYASVPRYMMMCTSEANNTALWSFPTVGQSGYKYRTNVILNAITQPCYIGGSATLNIAYLRIIPDIDSAEEWFYPYQDSEGVFFMSDSGKRYNVVASPF